jgi:hypothetical protein
MEFISPNTISLAQPKDLGIIKNLIFSDIMKMETVKKQLLNKLHQDQEKNEDDTTKCEQVSNQDTREFIVKPQLNFMQ